MLSVFQTSTQYVLCSFHLKALESGRSKNIGLFSKSLYRTADMKNH